MANNWFERHPANPLITADDLPYRANTVFNPGVTEHDGYVVLLLRVEDRTGKSHITTARSKNGIDNWEISSKPLIAPDKNTPEYCEECWGCEDPRVSYIPSLGKYAICYTCYSPMGCGVSIATTNDFESIERYGMVLAPPNKNAAIFPKLFNDQWVMLHRPMNSNNENIWTTRSSDMKTWGKPKCLMSKGEGPAWDGLRVGCGAPPIQIGNHWLLIYHGVKQTPSGQVYRLGYAKCSIDNPNNIVYRHPEWILSPKEDYETRGEIPNILYTCGAILKDEQIWLYYGASDSCICLAKSHIDNFKGEIQE